MKKILLLFLAMTLVVLSSCGDPRGGEQPMYTKLSELDPLSAEMSGEILSAANKYYYGDDTEKYDLEIKYYLGQYLDAYAVCVEGNWGYIPVPDVAKLGDEYISIDNEGELFVYKDGVCLEIREAYKQGFINDNHVKQIKLLWENRSK